MIESADFCGSPQAKGIQKAIFENIGIKNLAPNISGIKLNNPDNGVIINNVHGVGGSTSDTLGKLIHLRACGRASGNIMITNIEDADMKDPHSAAIYIERDPTFGQPLHRVDIKHVHGFGGGQSTAKNATLVVIASSGISYSLEDIRVEHARLIKANGAGVGGYLDNVSIRDAWGSDTRNSTYISSADKVMIDLGNQTKNVLITGTKRIECLSGHLVDIAIKNNSTASPNNWVDLDNVEFVLVNTEIQGSATKVKTHTSQISPTFAVDATGIRFVNITHGLPVTPALQDCSLTLLKHSGTAVTNFRIDWMRIASTDGTYVRAQVNVGL